MQKIPYYPVQIGGRISQELLQLAEGLPPLLLVLLLLLGDQLVHEVGQDAGDRLQDHHRRNRVSVFLVPKVFIILIYTNVH